MVQLLLFSIWFLPIVISQSCPLITCSNTTNGSNSTTCFSVSGFGSTNTTFTTSACETGKRCYIEKSFYSTNMLSGSQINFKSGALEAECVYEEGMWNNFLPGSTCVFNYQCQSGNCTLNTCQGKQLDDRCISDDECGVGLFCQRLFQSVTRSSTTTKYYYRSCQKLLKIGDSCKINKELSKCVNGYKCMGEDVNDYTCKLLYSQTVASKTNDADYCSIPVFNSVYSNCANVSDQLYHNNSYLSYPYKCTSNSKQCNLIYITKTTSALTGTVYSDNYVNIGQCQCSFEDTSSAYCPFQGVSSMEKYYAALQMALLNSTRCHVSVVGKLNFKEWELCTDSVSRVNELKMVEKQKKDWPVNLNQSPYQCLSNINEMNNYSVNMYTRVETEVSGGIIGKRVEIVMLLVVLYALF